MDGRERAAPMLAMPGLIFIPLSECRTLRETFIICLLNSMFASLGSCSIAVEAGTGTEEKKVF